MNDNGAKFFVLQGELRTEVPSEFQTKVEIMGWIQRNFTNGFIQIIKEEIIYQGKSP